jgi:hypothetical protein
MPYVYMLEEAYVLKSSRVHMGHEKPKNNDEAVVH